MSDESPTAAEKSPSRAKSLANLRPPFEKGNKVGKSGGRPKVDVTQVDMRALAREDTLESIKTIRDIRRNGKSEMARLYAANTLLEKGWGKDNQPFSTEIPVSVHITSPLASRLLNASPDADN